MPFCVVDATQAAAFEKLWGTNRYLENNALLLGCFLKILFITKFCYFPSYYVLNGNIKQMSFALRKNVFN